MYEEFIAQIRMTDYPNRGNKKQLVSLCLMGVALLALGGCGGGVKIACQKFNEEMKANTNPIEFVEKANSINKGLFDALGITYYEKSDKTLEQIQSNMKGLMEAREKCTKEGVTF